MSGFKCKKNRKILTKEKNLNHSNGLVLKVFQVLRIIIQRYMYFVYNTELLGDVNGFFWSTRVSSLTATTNRYGFWE